MQTTLLNNLLSMSLKRYLCLIIALVVSGLAATQLVFINYIQQQITTEVEDKSQAWSKQGLDWKVFEKDCLARALNMHQGNRTKAAPF
jgi:cell division protein FtsL